MGEDVLKNNLRVLRAIQNISQETLGEKVGVTRGTINNIENEKWVPSTVLALKIARVFNVQLEKAFWLEEKPIP